MEQMGEWYLQGRCGKTASESDEGGNDSNKNANTCCAAQPFVKCHYRDKPSINSCSDSPPKDEGGKSFW